MEGKERDQRAYEKVKQHLLGLLLSIVLQVAKEMGDSYPVRLGLASMQLRGGICESFPGVCHTAASGLRWRFRIFLPSAVQSGSVGIRPGGDPGAGACMGRMAAAAGTAGTAKSKRSGMPDLFPNLEIGS